MSVIELKFADGSIISIEDPKLSINIKKGIVEMPLPSEDVNDVQASGAFIMSMGGTTKQVNIRYTIVGNDQTSFVNEFNRQYKLYSSLSLADNILLTIIPLNGGDALWTDVPTVLSNVSFKFLDGAPNAVEVNLTLSIGMIV